MKKNFLFAALAAVSILFAGCSKDSQTPGNGETPGNDQTGFKITFNFEAAPKTAAPQSTAVPITDWSSIKSLILVMTQGTGASEVIKDARAVAVPGVVAGDNVKLFTGVTASPISYNVYLIANAEPTAAATGFYGGAIVDKGLTGDAVWTPGMLKGKNMADMKLALKNLTGTYYQSPTEIFVAKSTLPVTVVADNVSPINLSLARVVSLVRVRVCKDDGNGNTTGNLSADLLNIASELQLARIQEVCSPVSGVSTALPNTTDYIYSQGAFKNSDPTSGYNAGGTIVSGDAVKGFRAWKELIMFPTTSLQTPAATVPSNQKLFVKIAAWVPAGYKFADDSPTNPSVAGPGGQLAYWGANVDCWFKANDITEINCTLTTSGNSKGEDVYPTEEGNMNITIELTPWNGNIQETSINM